MCFLCFADNFGFENPNYNKLVKKDVGGGGVTSPGEEELNNSVDLYYERNDTVWTEGSAGSGGERDNEYEDYVTSESTRKVNSSISINDHYGRVVKNRHHYARMGAGDMGVPTSPSVDGGDQSILNRSCGDFSPLSGRSGGSTAIFDQSNRDSEQEVIEEIHDVWYKKTKDSRRISRSGNLLIFKDDDNEERKAQDRRGDKLRQYRSLNDLSIDVNQEASGGETMYANGTYGHQQRQQQYVDDAAVDYSPHDFRRSFAAIDQASRERPSSSFYAGGGLRMRKETDGVTVVTEHRDPYSFYWQLDKAKKEEEEPPREIVTENVIEEIAVEEST